MALEPKTIAKAARRLGKFLKKNSRHASPEQVHRLRTTIRRLETAVDTLLPKPKRRERTLLREMKRIRKRAGKVRDMDVLTGDAISVRLPGVEQEQLVELIQHLGVRRRKQAKRLRSVVQKQGREVSRGVKRLSSRLKRRIASQQNGKNAQVSKEAVSSAVELLAELKQPPTFTLRNLHPYRLKVKKLRDVLHLAQGQPPTDLVDALDGVKDAIGDWHDWEELHSIGNEVLGESSGELVKKIKQITARKFEQARSSATRMRQKYITGRNGKIAPEALRSTSALAS